VSGNAQTAALEALVEAHTAELHLPTVRRRFRALAAEATREQQTPLAYLAALLEAEVAERAERRERRRLLDARFPLVKRLEDFRFADNPSVPQATIAALAEGSWITASRSSSAASRAPARRTSRSRSRSAPASKADASASPPSPRSPTSYKKPSRAASCNASSPATPAPSSWSSTSSATSPSPKERPSSSSR